MQTDQERLIPVIRAAAQLGISRQSLDVRLRSRGIKIHRITRKGRLLVLLDQAQIRTAMQNQRADQRYCSPTEDFCRPQALSLKDLELQRG